MTPKRLALCLALSSISAFAQQSLPDSPVPNAPAITKPETSPVSSTSVAELPKAEIRYSTSPGAEVTVLEDTLLRVRTNTPISTATAREGAAVSFVLSQDVSIDTMLVIPRGATVHGTVVHARKAGTLAGAPDLTLKLVSLEFSGHTYPVYTYQFKITGVSKARPTEALVQGGVVVGALAGAVVTATTRSSVTAANKLVGASAGAAVGAGLATLAAAAAPGPAVTIPAESQLDFYLASPIAVVPPTREDAERLSHHLHTGEPVLYVRGETP